MKYRTLIILLIIPFVISGQKFGDISTDDLMSTYDPIDSSANAAYLINKNDVTYYFPGRSSLMRITTHKRIKIYNSKGEDYANFEIYLYRDGSSKETIGKIKAFTYNLENGKVVKTKLEKDQIFKEDINENFKVVKFALPKVKEGSIVEVQYDKTSPFLYTIPQFFFQNYIPTKYAHFRMEIPNFFGVTPIVKGTADLQRSDSKLMKNRIEMRVVELIGENLKPIKEDDYVLNDNDYRSSIKWELHSISWPGQHTEYLSKDWVTIGNNLLENKMFGKQLNKEFSEFDNIIEQANQEADTIEKIRILFNHIRDNYSWNEENARYSEKGLKDVVKKKTGNIVEINLLLLNLIRQINIDAEPVFIKSRSNGLLNSGYPSLSELNYLIVLIKNINGKTFLLDSSSKNHPMELLPLRAINLNGLCIQENSSHIIEYPNPNKYISQSSITYDIKTDEELIQGEGKTRNNIFASVKYRMKAENIDDEDNQDIEETEEEDMEDDESDDFDEDEEEDIAFEDNMEILEVNGFENVDNEITFSFSSKKYNCVSFIKDQVFINADLDFGLSKNPFTEESREFPVFYNSLNDFRRIFILNIPEYYSIESLPENLNMVLPDQAASFLYEIKNLEDKLIISFIFKVNRDVFLPQEYPNLKEFYKRIIDKQEEQIILKKM